MANEEHLAILKKGVKEWNDWRKKNPDVIPDLNQADLGGLIFNGGNLRRARLIKANLHKAVLWKSDLSEAALSGACLSWADLVESDLFAADLLGADLSESKLIGANFRFGILAGANLAAADLSGANLGGANLRGAFLDWARLTESTMEYTTLGDVDLRSVEGLESVRHGAPSSIGIDTIYRSKGKIPEVFLRGAGVPEEFITYMKSLVMNPIEFYSCFISYSTKDQEFAERLHGDLQNKNVRCWFAPHDVQGGKKLHEQIDEAIRVHEKVLLILSAESMNSEWVKTEIAKARKREVREKKQVLFPVRLVPFEAIRDWECFDADAGKDSAREIREYFIPDFSEWKEHDKYKKAFERLLGDLKAGERRVES
jgi:hypothetical protein